MDPLSENFLPDLAQTFKTKHAPLATGIAELLAGQQIIFNTLAGMQKQLAQVNRRSACVNSTFSKTKLEPLTEQEVAVSGNRMMKFVFLIIHSLHNLGEDVTTYLANHGILPENIPHLVTDRRKKLAEIIGCIGYYEEM
ncbi:hypothetical protein EV368DRAFT_69932 [Lentinula lateritia]|nr:hypothetical protein EV368DRAFT_69932 [Lentinula lateritia]